MNTFLVPLTLFHKFKELIMISHRTQRFVHIWTIRSKHLKILNNIYTVAECLHCLILTIVSILKMAPNLFIWLISLQFIIAQKQMLVKGMQVLLLLMLILIYSCEINTCNIRTVKQKSLHVVSLPCTSYEYLRLWRKSVCNLSNI